MIRKINQNLAQKLDLKKCRKNNFGMQLAPKRKDSKLKNHAHIYKISRETGERFLRSNIERDSPI